MIGALGAGLACGMKREPEEGEAPDARKRVIGLRKQSQVFGRGTIEFLPANNRKILAYLRKYKDDEILCVANLSRSVQPVELDLSRFRGLTPVEALFLTEFPPIGEHPYFLTLGGYAFYAFRLQ